MFTTVSIPASDIFVRVVIIFSLAFFGVIARRFRLLRDEAQRSLTDIVIYIAIPAIIFVTMAAKVDWSRLIEGILTPVVSMASIFVIMGISRLYASVTGFNPKRKGTFIFLCMIPNTVFVGYPVVYSVLGKDGLAYAVLFDLSAEIILWSVAVGYLKGISFSPNDLKAVMNPALFAVITGLSLNALGIKIPSLIVEPFETMGQAAVPLAMLLLGYTLSGMKIKRETISSMWREIGAVCLIKLLVFPVVAWLLMLPLTLDPVVKTAILLQSSMPSMASSSVMAQKFGGDVDYAASTIFATSLLSIFTIPLIISLLGPV